MIIIKLIGGLGNQMFQYSLGRFLAINNDTTLKLDLNDLMDNSYKENFTNRTFELNVFNIVEQIATRDEIGFFIPDNTLRNRAIKRITNILGTYKVVTETKKSFQTSVLTKSKNVYLNGYWQSEKYFLPISNLIRNDFTLKSNLLSEINNSLVLREKKKLILETNSVSVHFRRGDYVTNPVTNKFHGTCSEKYYHKAMAEIKLKISNPFFFLFSDDSDWLEENFSSDLPFTIIKNEAGYVDLYLMSLCKHNIIANSSFSWWGAWLNRNHEKIVIAPSQWFANFEKTDIIPKEWICL